MCGIFAYLVKVQKQLDQSKFPTVDQIWAQFAKLKHRGPDDTKTITIQIDAEHILYLGFHRLAINDLSPLGNQPLKSKLYPNVLLLCNGEIYNCHDLEKKFGIQPESHSDCEVILHLYKKFGWKKTMKLLDGVFAAVLYDGDSKTLYVGHDPIGVRCLYYGTLSTHAIAFCSEIKAINSLCDSVQLFPGGQFLTYKVGNPTYVKENYYNLDYSQERFIFDEGIAQYNEKEIMKTIQENLIKVVGKQMLSDRPVGCLLSGGLDSSLISAIAKRYYRKDTPLHTFAIGMTGSPDLKYAKIVADFIGSVHHEILVTPDELIAELEHCVYQIETYDTTTIRASTPMLLMTKWITTHTDVKVIMSGEGSDEASGSYMYFHNAPSTDAFHDETIRLLKELPFFDVQRCDKSIAAHGLEARVPFLDRVFLEMYMQICPTLKVCRFGNEKYLLRKAFENIDILPKEVLWRRKEAFSDGISMQTKSWFQIIQERCEHLYSDQDLKEASKKYPVNPPLFKEALYYRDIFSKHYPNRDNIIPHYWLPKWSGDIKDPSARHLQVYQDKGAQHD